MDAIFKNINSYFETSGLANDGCQLPSSKSLGQCYKTFYSYPSLMFSTNKQKQGTLTYGEEGSERLTNP